ncbi:hypothetical protein AB2N04_06070 [Nitratireductor sp. GISD-1A_MAKvit]
MHKMKDEVIDAAVPTIPRMPIVWLPISGMLVLFTLASILFQWQEVRA